MGKRRMLRDSMVERIKYKNKAISHCKQSNALGMQMRVLFA